MKQPIKVQKLTGHAWMPELVLLARWDKMGRNPNKKISYDPEKILDKLNQCVILHFNRNKRRGRK